MLTSSSTQRHGSEAKPVSYPLTQRGADWWGGTDLTNLNSQYINRESRHHRYISRNPCWSNQHLLSTSGCWRLWVVLHVPPPHNRRPLYIYMMWRQWGVLRCCHSTFMRVWNSRVIVGQRASENKRSTVQMWQPNVCTLQMLRSQAQSPSNSLTAQEDLGEDCRLSNAGLTQQS